MRARKVRCRPLARPGSSLDEFEPTAATVDLAQPSLDWRSVVKLGIISLWGDDLADFIEEVKLAESCGYDRIGIGDSPAGWRELYVSLTLAASNTRTVNLAPMVTTPLGRSPLITANAMSSLHDMSDGRVSVIGFGSGASIASAMGRGLATIKENRDYMLALRDLLNGKETLWEGKTLAPLKYVRQMPIYFSATGPKALALAGEVADGVVTTTGSSLEEFDAKIQIVRSAAKAAGRDPMSVDVWAYSYIAVRESREKALDDIISFLATTGAHELKNKGEQVPDHLKDKVLELQRQYDPADHAHPEGPNAKLIKRLGLADYLAGFNSIAGTPEYVGGVARELKKRGVSCLFSSMPGNADRMGTIKRLYSAVNG
jgi:5,10-methylenetetrahydromethanopterin reductase